MQQTLTAKFRVTYVMCMCWLIEKGYEIITNPDGKKIGLLIYRRINFHGWDSNESYYDAELCYLFYD